MSLVEEHRAAVIRYTEAMIAVGTAAEALPALEEIAAEQPLDEAAHALLIRAYGTVGRRAQAHAVFHDIRRRLADELGADPGHELAAAHTALLKNDNPNDGTGGRPCRRSYPQTSPGSPAGKPSWPRRLSR